MAERGVVNSSGMGWLLRAAGAVALATIVAAACAWLGAWQLQRALDTHDAAARNPPDAAPTPIADVMRPGEPALGQGTLVEAPGHWGTDAALLVDRTIDGVPAVILVRPFVVDAGATGTSEEATVGVLSGWLPDSADVPLPVADDATVRGTVRGSEAPSTDPIDRRAPAGGFWVSSLATATLAQHWEAPVYSGLLVADQPAPGWRALPPPEESAGVNLRSATYAAEWWLFGAFAVFFAARWIRDNRPRRTPIAGEEDR